MSPADIKAKSENAVRTCLADIPFLRIGRVVRQGADLCMQVNAKGKRWTLLVEAKASGQPRTLREAAAQLRSSLLSRPATAGIIVAPYVTAAGAQVCEEAGLSYVDLAGNCRLAFDNVFVEREGRPNPFATRRQQLSLYRPKAARILRVLLANPKRSWKVKALAAEAGVSLGHVANVKQALLEQELAGAEPEGLRLLKPEALLAGWAQNYDLRQRETRDYYSLDSIADIEERLAGVARRSGSKLAMTAFSAAARLAPFVKYQRATAYLLNNEQAVIEELGLRTVTSGANVTLYIPRDEGVFYGTTEVEGVPVASPVQVYLDLMSSPGRGEEAAQFLLTQVLKAVRSGPSRHRLAGTAEAHQGGSADPREDRKGRGPGHASTLLP